MNPYVLPLLFVAVVYAAMVVLNERVGLLGDHFSSGAVKALAYVWLALFMFVLTALVVASSLAPPTAKDLAKVPFYSLFSLHAILITFLIGWWLMAGRPALMEFFNIRREAKGEAVLTGFAVGLGGWVATIAVALTIALILQATGLLPKQAQTPAMIAWMAFASFETPPPSPGLLFSSRDGAGPARANSCSNDPDRS